MLQMALHIEIYCSGAQKQISFGRCWTMFFVKNVASMKHTYHNIQNIHAIPLNYRSGHER